MNNAKPYKPDGDLSRTFMEWECTKEALRVAQDDERDMKERLIEEVIHAGRVDLLTLNVSKLRRSL